MMRGIVSGLLPLLSTFAVAITLTAAGARAMPASAAPAVQAMDAAAHKQMMNDASDAQEDFRFAAGDKDQKAATEALAKLEGFMAQTESYWTAKKNANAVRLAKEARALAAQAAAAAKRGDMPGASAAFDKMGASCNSCHELHPEKS